MMRSLTDEQFADVLSIVKRLPKIDMLVSYEVVDDGNSGIVRTLDLITVTVTLHRKPMLKVFERYA